jgi:hypothetical protein
VSRTELLLSTFFVAACGGSTFTSPAGGGSSSTSTTSDPGGEPVDGGGALAPCPATVEPVGPCFTVTPLAEGASDAGDNAGAPQLALEPAGQANGVLLVLLNGSGGAPEALVADPVKNLYNAGASKGYHVLGLAYRSGEEVGVMCLNNDGCFLPTRLTILTGTFQIGAASAVADIRADESLLWRLDAALTTLAVGRPGAGWDAFRTAGTFPGARIVWSKVLAAGHSQGGGHAAVLGKLYPVHGVLQLSSTCDAIGATPATWTAASGIWATPSSTFLGFSAPTTVDITGLPTGGDTTCPRHLAVWESMGMTFTDMHDEAMTCAGETAHAASVRCAANYPEWLQILP